MAALIGPKKVHRYTVEFKIQAVRLSLHPDIQTQDVAKALTRTLVSRNTLKRQPERRPRR